MDTKPNRLSLGILMLGIVLVVVALSCSPNPSTDLYWQLRTGREILQRHAAPHVDTYSWTRHGSPWIAHEWLACVVFWLVYKAGHGFAGLLVFKAILLAITVAIFHFSITRSSGYKLVPAYLLTLCASYPLSIGFQARPQIFTYLFVTITAFAVLSLRNAGDTRKRLWGLVPLYILWANLHSGVYLGVFLLFVWSVGDLIDGYFGRNTVSREEVKKQGVTLLCITAACFLGTLINPYGVLEIANLLQTVLNQNAMNAVSEWTSPTLHGAGGINFAVIAGFCVIGMIYARNRARTADFIIVAVLLHFALYSLRNIPVFALVGVMTAAPYLFSWMTDLLPVSTDSDSQSISHRSILGSNPRMAIVFIGASGFLCISIMSTSVNLMTNLDWLARSTEPVLQRVSETNVQISSNPVQAVASLNSGLVPDSWKMYNGYGSGGFLIWALPGHPVSIDGRADVYFGEALDDYLTLNQWPYNWKQIVAKQNPDFVLTAPNQRQARLYMSSADWALVYVDTPDLDNPFWTMGGYNAMIFVRRSDVSKAKLAVMRQRCPAVLSKDFLTVYKWYPAVR